MVNRTPIDVGPPSAESATCSACGREHLPLWAIETRLICATCTARRYPNAAIRFGGPVEVITAQLTLAL